MAVQEQVIVERLKTRRFHQLEKKSDLRTGDLPATSGDNWTDTRCIDYRSDFLPTVTRAYA